MGLSAQHQVRYWGIATAVFVAFVWVMGNTLLPFIVGAAIAYLLDPLADRLERRGMSRAAATTVITSLAAILILLLLLFAIPVVVQQIQALVNATPGWVGEFRQFLTERFPELFDEGSAVRQMLAGMEDSAREGGVALLQRLLSTSVAVVDFVLLVVLAPVIAFYLLLDWDRLISRLDSLVPREHVATVRRLARESDQVLSGFVRGQLVVGLILGSFYAIALGLIGLQFGIIVGFFAGLVSFIPFMGTILGGLVSIGLALFQFWGDWAWVAAVIAVFVLGQTVEGNFLTPKLVGNRVKLHPVWLIFALSAFGSLLGFAGLLIAVPVAAVIGVLSRFAVSQYQRGLLYRGSGHADEAAGEAPRDAAE